ncbi:MAG: sigma-54 dependent transcriptional regulator [Myxococcota bacterium]|nr:sigma-54 dependent transcriptional regulator [Myxococcota bacterium]
MSVAPPRVLVVDDEEALRKILGRLLERNGFVVRCAENGEKALEEVISHPPDLILLDVRMPGISGLEVLERVREMDATLPVVLITAYADIHESVTAMKAGAFDYLPKPFDHETVLWVARRALAQTRARRTPISGGSTPRNTFSLLEAMGRSSHIVELTANVNKVANSDLSVLVLGETGTGKELVARAIHAASNRVDGPFVAVDCGAIPEHLLESELFGHERGAFTGADQQKPGKFEIAQGGTVFLDEIGNMAPISQAKFLRVIQDRRLYRVGGVKAIDVDIRFVAATNVELIETGFRHDLYYRLNEFPIIVPPLRERREDIPYLARRFVEMANIELGKAVCGLREDALELLAKHSWPGNVRELRSIIRRATLLAGEQIVASDLRLHQLNVSSTTNNRCEPVGQRSLSDIVKDVVEQTEREVIAEALRCAGGNKAKTARLLQVDYKTLHSKVKKYQLVTEDAD